MAKKLLNLFVALLVLLAGEVVGFKTTESRYKEMARIESLSQEDFHQEMLEKDIIVLKNFPPQLESVRYTRAGSLILSDRMGDIYLVHVDIIDHSKSYTLGDQNHTWYLSQKGDTFLLYKKGEKSKRKFKKFTK